jgi:hypothetical protein
MAAPPAERPLSRLLLAEACLVAACIRVGLRIVPVRTLITFLDVLPPSDARGSDELDACRRAASIAAARIAHPTCLFRSLVGFGLLARRGYPVAFQIGATTADGFAAHAWLTLAGQPLDADASEYMSVWHRPRGFSGTAGTG